MRVGWGRGNGGKKCTLVSKEQEFKTFSMLTQFESCIHLCAFVAEVFFFFNVTFFRDGGGE